MANYLEYLYQQRRMQPGLLGNNFGMASNGAAQLAQYGDMSQQQAAQAAQRVQAAMQQNEAEAARGLQQAAQNQAEEEARERQAKMAILSMATGGLGGGEAAAGEAATSGASQAFMEASKEALQDEFAKQVGMQAATPGLLNGIGFGRVARPWF